MSQSTIYFWVRDLPIDRKGRANRVQRRGNKSMQLKYRLLREAAYEEGRAGFDELAADPSFRDFVCLYLAEGYKRDRNVVSICNSDPAILKLASGWSDRLSDRRRAFSIQYHDDQDLTRLRQFWSQTLGIEPDDTRVQRKSNSGQLKGRQWRRQHASSGLRYTTRISEAASRLGSI